MGAEANGEETIDGVGNTGVDSPGRGARDGKVGKVVYEGSGRLRRFVYAFKRWLVDLCSVGKPKYEIMVECDVAKSVMGWLVKLFGAAGPQHAVGSRTLEQNRPLELEQNIWRHGGGGRCGGAWVLDDRIGMKRPHPCGRGRRHYSSTSMISNSQSSPVPSNG